MNFQDLLNKQQEQAKDPNAYKDKPTFSRDERFYQISKDDKGNGQVTVRFLPSFNTDKTELNTYTKYLEHSVNFEKMYPGKDKPDRKWSGILHCPRTLGKDEKCPICDFAWKRYNEAKENGETEEKTKFWLRNFTNNDVIVTNIQIISDKINPDNNGKIFLFKLSKTILDMFAKEAEKIREIIDSGDVEEIRAAGIPDDLTGFDPFNLLVGKNMVLKYKNRKEVKVPADYWGSSYFANAFTGIVENADEYKALVEEAYCLDEFHSKEFVTDVKTLKTKLNNVTFGDWKDEIFEGDEETTKEKKQKPEEKPKLLVEEPVQEAKVVVEKVEEKPAIETKKEVSVDNSSISEEEAFFASLG